jgi:hypothetical protein
VVAMPDEVDQKIEHLRLEGNKVRAAAQFTAIRVERKILEQIAHAFIPLVVRRPRANVARAR